jgi:hypothetical protein
MGPLPKWNGDDSVPVSLETTTHRKMRARVFKLKKWIVNIEGVSKKTPAIKAKLKSFYNELDMIQGYRGGFTKNTVSSIMDGVKTRRNINGLDL